MQIAGYVILVGYFIVLIGVLLFQSYMKRESRRLHQDAVEALRRDYNTRVSQALRNYSMSSHHETLGVPTSASTDEIVLAYRRLAKIHHPDKGGKPEDFERIRKAYEFLMKPAKCPDCEGKGFIKRRDGAAINRIPCPRCWGTK